VIDDSPNPDVEEVLAWALYEARKARWIADNPGAWPAEVESFCARLREEIWGVQP